MKRFTYWNEERQRYEINDACMIHSGSITDRLAHFENLQTECIKLTGCGLEMLAMKYKEFMDDIARLHAFDSTGLTPESVRIHQEIVRTQSNCIIRTGKQVERLEDELKAYKNAEEQGLLLRLPCKVSDTLYAIDDDTMFREEIEGIIELEVRQIVINIKSDIFLYAFNAKLPRMISIPISYIGKTVFITREAAEAALKGGADK